jgi:hypothetical protein
MSGEYRKLDFDDDEIKLVPERSNNKKKPENMNMKEIKILIPETTVYRENRVEGRGDRDMPTVSDGGRCNYLCCAIHMGCTITILFVIIIFLMILLVVKNKFDIIVNLN